MTKYHPDAGALFLPPQEFARKSGIPLYLIRRWVNDGTLPVIRAGRVKRINVEGGLKVLATLASSGAACERKVVEADA